MLTITPLHCRGTTQSDRQNRSRCLLLARSVGTSSGMSAWPLCRRLGSLTPAPLHCRDGSQACDWETVPEGTALMCAAPMRHTETRSSSDSSSSSSSGAEAARWGGLELGRAIGAICVGLRDDGATDGDR